VKSFKKCCISSAADGTDYNMLWYKSEEDVNIRTECVCEIDKDIDCEDGDSDTDG